MVAQALSVNLTKYQYISEILATLVTAWARLPSERGQNRERLPIWTYSESGLSSPVQKTPGTALRDDGRDGRSAHIYVLARTAGSPAVLGLAGYIAIKSIACNPAVP